MALAEMAEKPGLNGETDTGRSQYPKMQRWWIVLREREGCHGWEGEKRPGQGRP